MWGRGLGGGAASKDLLDMPRRPANKYRTSRARELREQKTKAESLIWTVLRAKRLAGLKFRRQHPTGPYFADFACVEKMTIVELDGEYHEDELQHVKDSERQAYLEALGWKVVRFSNEEVINDVESVAISIARQMNIEPVFKGLRVD